MYTPTNVDGTHDHDTILINTIDGQGSERLDSFSSAMVLVHEYRDVTAVQSAGTDQDPLVDDPIYGACDHAAMIHAQMLDVIAAKCESPAMDPDHRATICGFLSRAKSSAEDALSRCTAMCPTAGGTFAEHDEVLTFVAECCEE